MLNILGIQHLLHFVQQLLSTQNLRTGDKSSGNTIILSYFSIFLLLSQAATAKVTTIAITIIIANPKKLSSKGTGTFIPQKLEIKVGIAKIIVIEVNVYITPFKLFEIIEAYASIVPFKILL